MYHRLVSDEIGPVDSFGPNAWLVDEMYEQYLIDANLVSEAWREFFADYRKGVAPTVVATSSKPAGISVDEQVDQKPASPTPAKSVQEPAKPQKDKPALTVPAQMAQPIKGVGARIVTNMESSLTVPTATSFRVIPAKLLEVNRLVINGYLGRSLGGKVSFTHLIGYAVVKALESVPVMNSAYFKLEDGPGVLHHDHVGLGIAVDLEKPDGSRSLLVPCIKGADAMNFQEFHTEYENLIRKVRSNKLSVDDFSGVTVTLTNPGTIGTVQSVPRLMPGQGLIVGVGSIDYPAEYQSADKRVIADLGISKVVTITSTYDHRIIQGAESGMFLQRVHELLMGADNFYQDVFSSLGVPYESVEWRRDNNPLDSTEALLQKQMQLNSLINMYRVRGHLIADLDPLRWREPHTHPELDPATYGFTLWDLDREFLSCGLAGRDRMTMGDILHLLRDAYCRTIGVEYMHIQEPEQKQWVQERVEGVNGSLDIEEQRHILTKLNAAEALERFLATKYVGAKRFGIEGAETAVPLLDAILNSAADAGMNGAVMGMAHRGRLNVLVNIVGKSYQQLFKEFEGTVDPDMVQGSGDVKYHLGAKGVFKSRSGVEIPVELAANPSHLEAVDPVVEGMVRAMQDRIDEPTAFSVLPILIHGDAAFAGQGVVAETLNLSDLKGYRTGGTIHLVINNQLGFTTSPEYGRSSWYCTDVAKMVQAPIFHVNGDDPEACVRVARLAFEFRQAFHKDVVIDLVCYRRHGHNEADDPSFTQPLMYKRIESRRSVRKLYVESLVKRGFITVEEAEEALSDFSARLQAALEETRALSPAEPFRALPSRGGLGVLEHIQTGVDRESIDEIFKTLSAIPNEFTMHARLEKQFDARSKLYEEGQVEWATAEALAFGSILLDGKDIRFAGQDSRRGTFSQRHAVLIDQDTGAEYTPLAHLAHPSDRARPKGKFWIYDSLLSEYAAVGFEYGYSLVHENALVCWEAQFGDFVNGAQIIIDQFIAAAEDKWDQHSGLVLLLPHGYDGQGPEHSSCRVERFLTLCAEDNIQVVNATTAAQYFHLLRRQAKQEVRKPLVVITPKYLLRAKEARSNVGELTSGSFEEILDDPTVGDHSQVTRVILCSGKVAYDALKKKSELNAPVAVVRVEQLYPFPKDEVAKILSQYSNATSLLWLQEEPRNMGPWPFVHGRLLDLLPDGMNLLNATRHESGSPATGSHAVHLQELEDLLDKAFGNL